VTCLTATSSLSELRLSRYNGYTPPKNYNGFCLLNSLPQVWTGHLGRKLFRRLVVAIEEFRFAKAAESNKIYKDSYIPDQDDAIAASDDPFGDHAEPKHVTGWRGRGVLCVEAQM
jgi:hypothetical protein